MPAMLRCLFLWLALLGAGGAMATPPERIRVVLDDNYPPYIFRDSQGRIQGILKDLWALWQERTGIAVDFQPMDWGKARQVMESGGADLIDTIFETPERRAIYAFSKPYATIEVALFFDNSISGIVDAESLKGFTVGVKAGDACVDFLQARGGMELRSYASYEAQVQAAIRREIRILCIDAPPAFYFFNREGAAEQFRHTAPLYVGQFHRAVAKGREDLLQVVEAGFARISAEEKAAIETRWMGHRFGDPGPGRWLARAALAVGLLSLLVLALVLWNRSLRRRVGQRTRELHVALEQQKESETRLRTILDNVGACIYLKDPQGKYLYVNQPVLDLWQCGVEQVVGHGDECFFDEPTTANIRRNDRRVLEEGLTLHAEETNHVPATGVTLTYLSTKLPLRRADGSIYALCGISHDISARKLAEQALAASEAQLSLLIDAIPDAVQFKDGEGRWLIANRVCLALHGLDEAPWQGLTDAELARQHPRLADSLAGCARDEAEAWQHAGPSRSSTLLRSADGQLRHTDVIRVPLFDEHHQRQAMVIVGRDVTALVQARADQRLYEQLFEHSAEAILVTDQDNHIVNVNPAFTRLTGYALSDVRGHNPKILAAGMTPPEVIGGLWHDLQDHGYWQGELWDRRKDGAVYPKLANVFLIRDEAGQVTHHVSSFSDISAQKQAAERIEHLAHHDALTGLFNRFSLSERLDQALLAARRDGAALAVMFIDMDRFKQINDTLGHGVGDRLLVEIAHRLLSCVRESDIVARLGGDEFVVVLSHIGASADVLPVADKILRTLGQQPYAIDGHTLHSSPSIGVAIYPQDGGSAEELLKNADVAMYHAKDNGRNNVQFFTAALNAVASERLQLERELREALRQPGSLELHYQPQVRAACGSIEALEALVRWRHPQHGLLPPARFIPVAEESGLIEPLGAWVLDEACRQLAAWRSAGLGGVRMAVNLSAQQLRQQDLVALVGQCLQRHGLQHGELELEITESTAMEHPERAIRQLEALRDLGVQLAIDDFGTGYSSLAYLKNLPIHSLKLDRSFVRDIESDANDAAICAATVALAHTLGLRIVAEGVETEGQRAFLHRHGSDLMQGYLFGRPEPAPLATERLRRAWQRPAGNAPPA